MPAMGLEPIRCCHRQILSLVRLPFRHAGINIIDTKIILPYPKKDCKIFFRNVLFLDKSYHI